MRIKPIRSLALAFGPLVLAIAAVAFYATPVQGSGASDAIGPNQLQGSGDIRVGEDVYSVVSTVTIPSLVPGAGHTLVGTATHTLDFGGGNTLVTSDDALLVPVNNFGLYQMRVSSTIVSGTGSFAGATGDLTFTGRINLAVGHADWRVPVYLGQHPQPDHQP